MRAIKAQFDGEKIILPREFHGRAPGEVIVIVNGEEDDSAWLKAQESAFADAWDNDEDAEYDKLSSR